MSELRVFVNYLQHSRSKADTDVTYPAQMAALAEFDDRVTIVFNSSKISALIADWARRLSITRLSAPRFGMIAKIIAFFARNTLVFPWQLHDIDVAWSHWFFPCLLTTKKIPVLFSSGFPSNEYAGASGDEERLPEVDGLQRWFTRAKLVSFPAQSWIHHFNAIDSGFAAKIVFLPLLLKIIPLEDIQLIERKYAAPDTMRLLFVGRDGERKGLLELHQALSQLLTRRPDLAAELSVTIVSETVCPPFPRITARQYRSLPRSEVHELMRHSHLFCQPTKRDSYGIAIIEAMANGCTIIADNRDPRLEILDDGRCGILTDATAGCIAAAIESLMDDRRYARELAINAWERYCSIYSFAASAHQHLRHLRMLAHGQ